MNTELLEALELLEKEKNIPKQVMLEAIETSLLAASAKHFGKADNIRVHIDPDTCDYEVYAEKTVVEDITDSLAEISLPDAQAIDPLYKLGDIVRIDINTIDFCRIAAQQARQSITQTIREQEKESLYKLYAAKEGEVVNGVVQRFFDDKISVNIGKIDAILNETEQVRSEHFKATERIKVYITKVEKGNKGTRVLVSRTHPFLVKRLFEAEVVEVKEGIVEIKSISREAGSRTKIAVWSNDPNVDPVGACVGLNGARVNSIVDELRGEKIDIINWDENPAILIENALSPAKVIFVIADEDENKAQVVVPDYQLSLAIGKEGQNARLAARLTGFKIDIKSETQARESGLFDELGITDEYVGYGEYEDVEEEQAGEEVSDGFNEQCDDFGPLELDEETENTEE